MTDATSLFASLRSQIQKVIAGCDRAIELSLIGAACEGHLLFEGVPGTAKTILARCIAMVLDLEFRRAQFTPDLMPSDVIGTNILDLDQRAFTLQRGPVFTNILLADEINRAAPKTQAALLEAMQERQVSIDGVTHELRDVFMVIATQNPIDMEGTYPLPEAQLDRFLFKIPFDYPDLETEKRILSTHHGNFRGSDLKALGLEVVAGAQELRALREVVRAVKVLPEVVDYTARLIRATREHPGVTLGVGSRGGLMLLMAARGQAALLGRDYATPDDIKAVAEPALVHRMILTPSAELQGLTGIEVVREALGQVEVPR